MADQLTANNTTNNRLQKSDLCIAPLTFSEKEELRVRIQTTINQILKNAQ